MKELDHAGTAPRSSDATGLGIRLWRTEDEGEECQSREYASVLLRRMTI